MTVPPAATSMSLATPSAGLAVMPEFPSDPPHLVPSTNWLAGNGSRRAVVGARQHLRHQLDRRLDGLLRATLILHAEHRRALRRAVAADLHEPLIVQQITHRAGLAAQANQHEAADVRMPGDAAHHAVENLMMLARVLHAAASLMREGRHAIDIRKLAQGRIVELRVTYLLTEAEQFTVEITAM